MTYATYQDVAAGFRVLTADEQAICTALLEEAAVIIDAYNKDAKPEAAKVVSCRMVRRAMGAGEDAFPLGASQGTMSAGSYSQSWTLSGGGSTGELYLSKIEKKMLGCGDRIGARSPLEGPGRCCC